MPEDSTPSSSPGAIARQMHESGIPGTLQAPVDDCRGQSHPELGFTVENGVGRFSSIAARNAALARHVWDGLRGTPIEPDRLFAEARRLWRHEIGAPDKASGRMLALASEQVDVLQLAATRIEAGARHAAFDTLHLVEALLQHADQLPIASVLALNDAQHPKTQGDLAAGILFNSIEDWLGTRPQLAEELAACVLNDPTEARHALLHAAWLGWFRAQCDASIASLLGSTGDTRAPLPAARASAAARMLVSSALPGNRTTPLVELLRASIRSSDQVERRVALNAVTTNLHQHVHFQANLRQLIEQGDTEALAHVAFSVGLHKDVHLQHGTFFTWLQACLDLDPQYAGALDSIDSALSALLVPGGPHVTDVLTFLTEWIRRHEVTTVGDERFSSLFDSCAAKLADVPELSRVVLARWFRSDDAKLCAAASSLVMLRHRDDETESRYVLDASELQGDDADHLKVIAYRMTGWIIAPKPLLTLVVSMLAVPQARSLVHGWLPSLLTDEIGYDYPGTTITQLRQAADQRTDPAGAQLLRSAADEIERRMQLLEALEPTKELAPPRELRQRMLRLRAKQMEQTHEQAHQRSFLSQIVTNVHIKAGRSTFSYVHGDYSAPTNMGSLSVSMELPRREILDPVGNSYRMARLRTLNTRSS